MAASFQLLYDRVKTFDFKALSLCRSKDMLGYITDTNTIVIKRISHQTQTISKFNNPSPGVAMTFKQDGNCIVLITNSEILIFGLSSSGLTKLYSYPNNINGLKNIQAVNSNKRLLWADFPDPVDLPPSEPTIPIVNYPEKPNLGYSLLLVNDSKNISFFVNGVFPLGYFSPKNLLGESVSILEMDFSKDFSWVSCVLQKDSETSLAVVDTQILNLKSCEIMEVGSIFSVCVDLFNMIKKEIMNVKKDWAKAVEGYKNKYLYPIESESFGNSIQEILFKFLTTGVMEESLSKFIKEEMQNLKNITQTIQVTFT